MIEELVELGVKRIVRVGTCGGLQPDLKLGELIVAISAVAADSTATHLVTEPHTPTADWELVHGAVHAAKELDQPVRVGPVVSSDLFYNPDDGPVRALVRARDPRGGDGGGHAVHARRAQERAGRRLLTVSDVVVEGEFMRITDEELRAAVDQMTELALTTVTSDH